MSKRSPSPRSGSLVLRPKPYRRGWFKSVFESEDQNPIDSQLEASKRNCTECWGTLRVDDYQKYCGVCGLVHQHHMFWQVSLDLEAKRRQFDHNSEDGSGTLQDRHVVAMEDSIANTFLDGDQLDGQVYSLDEYNDGRDAHGDGYDYKLNRELRFLCARAEAIASEVGLTGQQIDEVVYIVKNINSGAFTYYGPDREGGGQDAHIIAALVFVGNKYISSLSVRVETRETFQTIIEKIGMDRGDVRGAVTQLKKQLKQ